MDNENVFTDVPTEMPNVEPEPQRQTVTIEDVENRPKPKRVRPSRAKVKAPKLEFTDTGDEVPVVKKETRRPVKLKGSQVEQLFAKSSKMAVMLGADARVWLIDEKEIEPFSDEFAELLNSIPTRYLTTFVDMSALATVAVGLYSVFVPRFVYSRQLKMVEAQQAMNGQTEEPVPDIQPNLFEDALTYDPRIMNNV